MRRSTYIRGSKGSDLDARLRSITERNQSSASAPFFPSFSQLEYYVKLQRALVEQSSAEAQIRAAATEAIPSVPNGMLYVLNKMAAKLKHRFLLTYNLFFGKYNGSVATNTRLSEANNRFIAANHGTSEEKNRSFPAHNRISEANNGSVAASNRISEAKNRSFPASNRSSEAGNRSFSTHDSLFFHTDAVKDLYRCMTMVEQYLAWRASAILPLAAPGRDHRRQWAISRLRHWPITRNHRYRWPTKPERKRFLWMTDSAPPRSPSLFSAHFQVLT